MTVDELLHVLDSDGPPVTKTFADGRVCEVIPMTYGKYRLTVGDGQTFVSDSF